MGLLGSVELDRLSFTVRASPDGSRAYVANLGSGTLSVVDVERRRLERTIDCTPHERLGGTHGLALISAG
jgi:YVTN family beta-propeller protein